VNRHNKSNKETVRDCQVETARSKQTKQANKTHPQATNQKKKKRKKKTQKKKKKTQKKEKKKKKKQI